MCHHELWPTSVSHLFSFLNSSLGLAGGKHYQKITIPVFRVLQNFAISGYFPYILSIAIFSPYFVLVGLLLQCVALFQSGNYCQLSNIRRSKSPNLNISRLVLQLSLPNPLKPCVKSRMKMSWSSRRQAMLHLHLNDQQCYCPLKCGLY